MTIRLEKPRRTTSPRSWRNGYFSEDKRKATKAIRLEAKEDCSDIRVRVRGNFQIKHPLPPHSILYTN